MALRKERSLGGEFEASCQRIPNSHSLLRRLNHSVLQDGQLVKRWWDVARYLTVQLFEKGDSDYFLSQRMKKRGFSFFERLLFLCMHLRDLQNANTIMNAVVLALSVTASLSLSLSLSVGWVGGWVCRVSLSETEP